METHVTSQNDLPVQTDLSLQIFKTDIKAEGSQQHISPNKGNFSQIWPHRGRSKN